MSRAIPCPVCGDLRFEAGPAGPPQRRCWACGHIWEPSSAPQEPPPQSARPARGTAACVVTEQGLLFGDGSRAACDLSLPGPMLATAVQRGCRQLWIGPAACARIGLPERLSLPTERRNDPYRVGIPHPWVDAVAAASWLPATDPPGLNPWLRLRRPDGRCLDLVFPHWDSRNPFASAASGGVLLRALELFWELVGLRYRRSPGSTGLALMSQHGCLPTAEQSPPPPAMGPADGASGGTWIAPSRPPEGGWLHAWDVNGMYLAACSTILLGFGEPVYHEGPPDQLRPDWPAYWRASITGGDGLPLPFRADGRPRWYVSPYLALASDLGLKVQIAGAWTWTEARRALTRWYVALRTARESLIDASTQPELLALRAVKATYTQSLGWLGGGWLQPGAPAFRPDWREAIIARAHCNLYRHVARVHELTGQLPFGQLADTLLYHSDEPDPTRTAEQLGLQVGEQLGKFKHVGSLAVEAVPQDRRSTLRVRERTFASTRWLSSVLDHMEHTERAELPA